MSRFRLAWPTLRVLHRAPPPPPPYPPPYPLPSPPPPTSPAHITAMHILSSHMLRFRSAWPTQHVLHRAPPPPPPPPPPTPPPPTSLRGAHEDDDENDDSETLAQRLRRINIENACKVLLERVDPFNTTAAQLRAQVSQRLGYIISKAEFQPFLDAALSHSP